MSGNNQVIVSERRSVLFSCFCPQQRDRENKRKVPRWNKWELNRWRWAIVNSFGKLRINQRVFGKQFAEYSLLKNLLSVYFTLLLFDCSCAIHCDFDENEIQLTDAFDWIAFGEEEQPNYTKYMETNSMSICFVINF